MKFPKGWNRDRVEKVIAHYDSQSEADAIAELIKRTPAMFDTLGKGIFVVLPYAQYRRLCVAAGDVIDESNTALARKESSSKHLKGAKKKLDQGRSRRSTARSASRAKRRAS